MNFPNIKVGMEATVQKIVGEKDTAKNLGSSALDTLLSTPALIELFIQASVKAVDYSLPEEFITIGRTVSVNHFVPTKVGVTVTVHSQLSSVNGNQLDFIINAYDENGLISTGVHSRKIMDKERFLKKIDTANIKFERVV